MMDMEIDTNGYRYIKFINYKSLTLWDVKRYVEDNISFKNPVKLRELLRLHIFPVSKKEMLDNNWQIISKINFSGNLFLRGVNEAKTFKGSLNKVDGDTLIYSKINARHGCIYYHSTDRIPFGVSSEYPAYKIDSTKILGEYLVMVLRSDFFKDVLNKKVTGISKARLKSDEFLDTEIPLLTLSQQGALVSAYKKKIKETEDLALKAEQAEQSINDYLLDALGVNNENKDDEETLPNDYKYMRFVRRKNISRWDVYNERCIQKSRLYKNTSLLDVLVEKPQYGAAYSSQAFDGQVRYIRITDISEDGTLNEEKVSAKGYSDQYLLKENDFLVARSGNTVGKTFLYKMNIGKAIFAGYLIRFKLDKSKVIPEYLLAYTKCSLYKEWIKGNMRVAAQPNINSQQYLDSPIILPPLHVQSKIVDHVGKLRDEISILRKRAQAMRTEALIEFENEIFE
jgi:type I restriction modification DNA specificity domain protein